MKNYIILIIVALFLGACGSSDTENTTSQITVKPTVDTVKIEKPFSNPCIIYGTDFGNFFKILYAQGKFDDMIAFTDSASVKKHGKKKLREFYEKKFKFGYELGKPHSINKDGDYTTLNYNANLIATKRVIRLKILLEHDSVRLCLPEKLSEFPG